MVICMAIRCDAYAVLYSLWVVTFLFIRRRKSEILWPFYIGFIAIVLPLQYLLILGWPPGLCLGKLNSLSLSHISGVVFVIFLQNVCFLYFSFRLGKWMFVEDIAR